MQRNEITVCGMSEGISEPGPRLLSSIMLELLGYLNADIVLASESKRRFRPFMLAGPKADEE